MISTLDKRKKKDQITGHLKGMDRRKRNKAMLGKEVLHKAHSAVGKWLVCIHLDSAQVLQRTKTTHFPFFRIISTVTCSDDI